MTIKVPEEKEFEAWLAEPTTRAWFEMLRRWQEDIKNQWSGGQFQLSTAEETFTANAQALGEVQLLDKLINIEFMQFEEVLKDDE